MTGRAPICTTTPYTAGANETAVLTVSASAPVPAGVHSLGVYPIYSSSSPWYVLGTGSEMGNGGVAMTLSASSSAVLPLTAGSSYVFGTGVWDPPGNGYTAGWCRCTTTVIITR